MPSIVLHYPPHPPHHSLEVPSMGIEEERLHGGRVLADSDDCVLSSIRCVYCNAILLSSFSSVVVLQRKCDHLHTPRHSLYRCSVANSAFFHNDTLHSVEEVQYRYWHPLLRRHPCYRYSPGSTSSTSPLSGGCSSGRYCLTLDLRRDCRSNAPSYIY